MDISLLFKCFSTAYYMFPSISHLATSPYNVEIVKISNFDPHRQAGLDTQAWTWRKLIILLVFLSVWYLSRQKKIIYNTFDSCFI